MRGTGVLLLAVCLFARSISSAADAPVRVNFLTESAFPGDLVVLEARLVSETYAEFSLVLPTNPLLILHAEEIGPVELAGRFTQTHRWVLQTVASGAVRLAPLMGVLQRGDATEPLELPAVTLEIHPYQPEALTDDPEPLVPPGRVIPPLFWLLSGSLLLLLLGLAAGLRMKTQRVQP